MQRARLGLTAKTMIGSLLPIALTLGLAAFGLSGLQTLLDSSGFVDRRHGLVDKAGSVERTVLQAAVDLHVYVITGEEQLLSAARQAHRTAAAELTELKKQVTDQAEAALIGQAEQDLEAWWKNHASVLIELRRQMGATGKLSDLRSRVLQQEGRRLFDQFNVKMSDFTAAENLRITEKRKSAVDWTGSVRVVMILLAIAVVVASFTKNYLMGGSTRRSLIEAVSLAEAISRGDLTHRVKTGKKRDEVGRLGIALNTMADMLEGHTRQILGEVDRLATSSGEISASVSELSTAISRTVSAVTQTTATVQQMREAVRVSSEKAKDLARSSQSAVETSGSGLAATEGTVDKMQLIREQMSSVGKTVEKLSGTAEAIEEIIATVQDIASQSNVLAVNASIEAARAGERGQGFSVVAHEMKSLSDQSREATKQVYARLEEIQESVDAVVRATSEGSGAVDAGVKQSVLAGESIRVLADNVSESSQVAGVIRAASEQQFSGVDQVAGAMTDIEQAAQQNLSNASQLEAAAQQLSQIGKVLRDLAGRYKV
jgi:methyl-accepting chemotaxis protein